MITDTSRKARRDIKYFLDTQPSVYKPFKEEIRAAWDALVALEDAIGSADQGPHASASDVPSALERKANRKARR